ncbi:SLBB domain-containing protein [Gammaproteobacteria bacterium]|nr:SLBB domain-containing protein [Gammaproteobacteria bacterium]
MSLLKLIQYKNIFFFNISTILFMLLIAPINKAQDLPDEFLDTLPADVQEQFNEAAKQNENEEKLEGLFRLDTSQKKNQLILKILKNQLKELELRVNGSNDQDLKLQRFGQNFFSSTQSSFMPINIANFGDDYVVDVGDTFNLQLVGSVEENFDVIVQRDGSLVIPEFGKIFISGLPLKDSVNKIEQFFKTNAVGIEPIITLASLRDIQVLMIGGIEQPGMYTLSGGSSILHALNVAGGINQKGSYRKIEIIRDNEVISVVDLYDILVFAKNIFSETLRSGDAIKVYPAGISIPITGGISNEGIYEIKDGESLDTLLQFAGGFSSSFGGMENVILRRVTDNMENFLSIPLSDINRTFLQPRDAVILPFYDPEVFEVSKATISGMVNKPGSYPINDQSTLLDLIKQAGGYKENAYPYAGIFKRKNAKDLQDNFKQKVFGDTINEIISNAASGASSIGVEALNLLLEEQKAQQNSGRIITTFILSELENNSSANIALRDGDEIVIPPLMGHIYLFGDFNEPNILPYNAEYGIKDYIKMVAGKKESATKHLIIIDPDGKSKYVRDSRFLSFNDNIDLYPGSIIYMPRNIGKVKGVQFAATVAPVLSSLAISLASLNSIDN